jgi:glycosyltransferase involved in cell wall biosynthesis
MNLSVLILTKNEQVNIAECLKSVAFSNDVVVYDSFSNDRTLEIAKQFPNVTVVQRKFDNWATHQNWGVRNIPFKNPWVLYVDADERVPQDLAEELQRLASADSPFSAYRVRRKDYFMGTWLKRSQLYPTWIVRFFKPEKISYERLVNPIAVVDGQTGELDGHLIHFPFSKGLLPWFERHNSYSSFEAVELRKPGTERPSLRELFTNDANDRRNALKRLFYSMPMRSAIRFFYLTLVRLGVLEGRAGMRYSAMISMYEYWISIKMKERLHQWRARTDTAAGMMLMVKSPVSETANPPSINVIIPTYNEASHIAESVKNALKLGPVFVLDSFSTDGTQQMARDAGATVVEHTFENYSRQKNWGLDNLPLTGDWVFILDADERITPELALEIKAAASDPNAADGYFVNRVVIMMGRAIRHGGMLPSWNLRFFKRGKCRYEDRTVHEHMVCDGRTDYLKYPMLHIRRESISEYLAKHIRYADMESDEWIKIRLGSDRSARAHRLFRDLPRYRLYLRRDYWPSVPFKPLVRFIYMYIFRLGFLDGGPGWHLACLMASYEYMISLLYSEKRQLMKEGRLAIDPGTGRVVAQAPHVAIEGLNIPRANPGTGQAPAG